MRFGGIRIFISKLPNWGAVDGSPYLKQDCDKPIIQKFNFFFHAIKQETEVSNMNKDVEVFWTVNLPAIGALHAKYLSIKLIHYCVFAKQSNVFILTDWNPVWKSWVIWAKAEGLCYSKQPLVSERHKTTKISFLFMFCAHHGPLLLQSLRGTGWWSGCWCASCWHLCQRKEEGSKSVCSCK